jgi:hypothetical protein
MLKGLEPTVKFLIVNQAVYSFTVALLAQYNMLFAPMRRS